MGGSWPAGRLCAAERWVCRVRVWGVLGGFSLFCHWICVAQRESLQLPGLQFSRNSDLGLSMDAGQGVSIQRPTFVSS